MPHPLDHTCSCSRRSFLGGTIGCGAYVAMAMAGASALTRRAFAARPKGEMILEEPFSRVEKIADGVWATIATPIPKSDYTTVSNGGIIAGRDAVLIIEGHNTTAGGAWSARTAKELTGRWPTHVVVTHLHGDHVNGLSGCLHPERPVEIISTEWTRRTLAERAITNIGEYAPETRRVATGVTTVLPGTVIDNDAEKTTLDLGGRTVTLRLRKGHTPSDLTIELDDPRVVFCGDLVFHQIFPYYGDALPTELTKSCAKMCGDSDTLYVPGHGSLATSEDLEPYLVMLDDIGDAATRAFKKGVPADEAWKTYEVPEALGEYYKWRPDVYRFAFEAWYRELKG